MGLFNGLFDIIAVPLGWVLGLIYTGIPNYFLAIFLFTLLIRAALFPLSLKSQKSQADRARLAPRLERLKKKYAKDPKKLQEKQMALYEKEGVSLTGGCLPMVVQMLILFGIISVIYSPLSHLVNIPDTVINTSVAAMSGEGKVDAKNFSGYYKELVLLQNLEDYEQPVKQSIASMEGYDAAKADSLYEEMITLRDQFKITGTRSLLQHPWTAEKGFADISVLWLIPLISGLTALLSSIISMHFTKQMTSAETQPGQGCTNVMMMVMMPSFSLFIAFTVPGGVGVYWICSNIISLLQTVILNNIYNPAKIRAQAEKEYEERRRQKQEDKKRLAEARAKEQRELAKQLNAEKQSATKKKKSAAKPKQPEDPAEQPEPQPVAEPESTEQTSNRPE